MTWEVRHADCLAGMQALEADSVDAVVTDPPYALTANKKGGSGEASLNLNSPAGRSRITTGGGFMGKSWDAKLPGIEHWAECLRVAKPGAYLVAFGGPRTSHRLVSAIEDAGWEIRDALVWLFGSGFPKSLNLPGGLGTALKPGHEPICLARNPLAGTVAQTVGEYGTGALNIDASRIGTADDLNGGAYSGGERQRDEYSSTDAAPGAKPLSRLNRGIGEYQQPTGRWPANVVLSHSPECREVGVRKVKGAGWKDTDKRTTMLRGNVAPDVDNGRHYADADGLETVTAWECAPDCAVALLDAQSGPVGSNSGQVHGSDGMNRRGGIFGNGVTDGAHYPTYDKRGGGASRFFYTAKASRREREAGLGGMPTTAVGMSGGAQGALARGEDEYEQESIGLNRVRHVANVHPTVKPLALMRWLCRLVTPAGGLILDPFCGSGSTGCAAVLEGFRFLGIDREAEYVEIARRRIAHWALQQASLFDVPA